MLEHLKKNPELFMEDSGDPLIRIVSSNKKKDFTDFYRIVVENSGRDLKIYFWIRALKNKPDTIMLEALNKQYNIMKELETYLNQVHYSKSQLLCCKPVALLPEFMALITKECKGRLFNSYLKRQIPLLSQGRIQEHCFNIGIWLRKFHECFKVKDYPGSEKDLLTRKFKEKYGHYPAKEMNYITNCHNDYSPRNIFVGRGSVEVIDYVGVEKGFPEEDISFFINYVLNAKFNLLYPSSLKKRMIVSFRRGYDVGEEVE